MSRRQKGRPLWTHTQSFQWAKPLQGQESMPCYYSKQNPKWLTRQNKEWQGWRGDLREKWVLSDLFHQVCLQAVTWQISAKWCTAALSQVRSEQRWSWGVNLAIWPRPAQADESDQSTSVCEWDHWWENVLFPPGYTLFNDLSNCTHSGLYVLWNTWHFNS